MFRICILCVVAILTFGSLAAAAEKPALGAATSPASQPDALGISGLPASAWLNTDKPIQAENLQGRLWVVAVVESWSEPSRKAAALLEATRKTWATKGVTAYLLSVESKADVQKDIPGGKITLPIGTESPLPMLLGLTPLPQVYLVGPDQTVVWSGPVWHLTDVLPEYYDKLTEKGLSHGRTNELTNRLNRATSALEHKEYFLATGMAGLVAQAAPPGHPLHQQANALLDTLNQIGTDRLAQGRQLLAHKKTAEAYNLLQTVAEQFYGIESGTAALAAVEQIRANDAQWAQVRRKQDEDSALRTLDLAQTAMTQGRYAEAQRYGRLLLDLYPKTKPAKEARQIVEKLHRQKALATQVALQEAQPAGPVLLNLAARYAEIGRYEEARRCYQQVIQEAANTPYAQEARRGLESLGSPSPCSQGS